MTLTAMSGVSEASRREDDLVPVHVRIRSTDRGPGHCSVMGSGGRRSASAAMFRVPRGRPAHTQSP